MKGGNCYVVRTQGKRPRSSRVCVDSRFGIDCRDRYSSNPRPGHRQRFQQYCWKSITYSLVWSNHQLHYPIHNL